MMESDNRFTSWTHFGNISNEKNSILPRPPSNYLLTGENYIADL